MTMAEFYAAREYSQRWARDYLRHSGWGRISLEEGWCRQLYNTIWQWHLRDTRAGKRPTFEDIKLKDKDIEYWRESCTVLNVRFERAVVLQEPMRDE